MKASNYAGIAYIAVTVLVAGCIWLFLTKPKAIQQAVSDVAIGMQEVADAHNDAKTQSVRIASVDSIAEKLGLSTAKLIKGTEGTGDEARKLLEALGTIESADADEIEMITFLKVACHFRFGELEAQAGRHATAIEHFTAAAALCEPTGDKKALDRIRFDLAFSLDHLGRYDEALPIAQQVLAYREATLGAEHPKTLSSVNNLGVLYRSKADYTAAEPLLKRVYEARERTLGPEHAETLYSANNLGEMYLLKGNLEAAMPIFIRTLEARERTLGREHPRTFVSITSLAAIHFQKGEIQAAETLYRRLYEASGRIQGPEHRHTINAMIGLAIAASKKKDFATAEPLYKRAIEIEQRTLGGEHPDHCDTLINFSIMLQEQGNLNEAKRLAVRAYNGFRKTLGDGHHRTQNAKNLINSLPER